MSKVICVKIPEEEVWGEFLAYVIRKHGKVKGVIGKELCEAIKLYLKKSIEVHEK